MTKHSIGSMNLMGWFNTFLEEGIDEEVAMEMATEAFEKLDRRDTTLDDDYGYTTYGNDK